MIDVYDSSDFVLLADVVPDIIQEIRYYSTYNFIGRRITGYEEPCAITTKETAHALKKASDEFLTLGYRIKVFDAYRPQRAVNEFAKWAADENDSAGREIFYPEFDKKKVFELGFLSTRSAHSRGSAVDITLFDAMNGKDVDMGGKFDYFGDESHVEFEKLTPVQHENRMILQRVMVSNGFKICDEEWWHFALVEEPFPNTFFDFPIKSNFM